MVDYQPLQEQLHKIKQRQYLLLVLLVIPYLIGIAELVGYAVAGVLFAIIGVIVFGVVAAHRRRTCTVIGP